MFRAQTNQFDEVVIKATDENLTSENWALILDVCDRVAASPTGPQSAVAALIKRLAHRNANVQIYTIELANALSQNCGAPLHRELASRSFTDSLLRLANDRNTHHQVKAKVLERMQGWSDMFKDDPDLGIMAQACDKLKRGNPDLEPPSKPQKHNMEDTDRRKGEEELQMALALSLREKSAATAANANTSNPDAVASTADNAQLSESSTSAAAARAGTTAATVSRVRALYDFLPTEAGELAFAKGDIIAVLESVYKDWWKGSLRGDTGIFPLNYVEKLQDPTAEELEHDAEMESEVFAQIRNVEKLLALLSVRSEGRPGQIKADNSEDEITELYHQTLAIRPKLIELIGKYSQKKDDFTSLNEKFIKARRDYEALLDSSMSPPYGRHRQTSQPYPGAYGHPQHPPYLGPQRPYGQQSQAPMHPHDPSRPIDPRLPQQPYAGYPTASQQAVNGTSSTPAPFHFIPGGVPTQGNATPISANTTPFQEPTVSARPQSIQLNPGFPQELASGAHEVPHEYTQAQFDQNPNAQSYSGQQPSQPQLYQQTYQPDPRQSMSPVLSPPQSLHPQQLPVRQRSESFEQQQQPPPYPQQQQQQQPPYPLTPQQPQRPQPPYPQHYGYSPQTSPELQHRHSYGVAPQPQAQIAPAAAPSNPQDSYNRITHPSPPSMDHGTGMQGAPLSLGSNAGGTAEEDVSDYYR